jgi:signal transduction histidine kinase
MKNVIESPRGPQTNPPLRWPVCLALLVALTLIAIAADLFAPQIFAGHSLVLGVVCYWIALRLVGPNLALLVLVISTGALSLKWGQPYSGAIIALEGLWVGYAWRRRLNPLVADIVFWAAVGTPLSWFLYTFVSPIPHPSLEHALGVQPVNGFIAIWIAYIIMELMESSNSLPLSSASQTLGEFLLKRFIAFGTFPLLVAGLLTARSFEQHALSEARQNLTATSQRLAAEIGNRIGAGKTTIRELAARQADPSWFHDYRRLALELAQTQQRSNLFTTMLAADSAGRIVSVSPPQLWAQTAPTYFFVTDRDYFIGAITSRQAYVSGIFRGRGFGSELLIAVSAPVIAHDGSNMGIVEGSMKVSSLAQLVRSLTPDDKWRILLSDKRSRVIASHGFDLRPLADLKASRLGHLGNHASSTPARFTDDTAQGPTSYLSVSIPVPDTDWTITVQREWGDVLQPVIEAYLWMIVVGLVTAALASLFTTWSIRDLLATGRNVIKFSREPHQRLELLEEQRSLKLPRELHELLHNLSNMAHRLIEEQRQREKLLAELESRVTERTSELQHALVAAESSARAKSAFLATVSHELRTPLTSIITGVGILRLARSEKAPLEVRTIDTLEKSARVLMSVISDVLDYSKLEAGSVAIACEAFKPSDLVSDIAAILSLSAQRSDLELRTVIRLTPDLLWQGDPQRLKQILLNLGGNAVKFTTAGFVEISVTLHEPDAATGRPRRLVIAVEDSGPGIAPEHLKTIFDAFVQISTNRVLSQAGTGIGLTISRRLVTAMGGEISVTSRLGEGSRFEFWIPEPTPPLPPQASSSSI